MRGGGLASLAVSTLTVAVLLGGGSARAQSQAPAQAQQHTRAFRLRAELVGASAFPTVGLDRHEDAYTHLDLELELPLVWAFTVGLRATPLYLYKPAGQLWIYGLGFGLTTRAYLRGDDHTGLFLGIAVSTLRSNRAFAGDSSRLNFLSQLSFGWQSPDQRWHMGFVFEHLSNAWTTDQNQGVNGLGAAVGASW